MPRIHPRADTEHLTDVQARQLQRLILADGRWYAEVFLLAQGLACVEVFPSVRDRTVSRRLRCLADWSIVKEEASRGNPVF